MLVTTQNQECGCICVCIYRCLHRRKRLIRHLTYYKRKVLDSQCSSKSKAAISSKLTTLEYTSQTVRALQKRSNFVLCASTYLMWNIPPIWGCSMHLSKQFYMFRSVWSQRRSLTSCVHCRGQATMQKLVVLLLLLNRPGSDLRFWNSTQLKLFQLTFQLSWNLFFQLTSKFYDSLFNLGLNGKIVILHSKRKQVHAIAIMTPSRPFTT